MHFFPYCFCKVVQFFMGQNTEKWWWGAKTSLRVILREKCPNLALRYPLSCLPFNTASWKMPLDRLLLKGVTQEKEERRVLNSQDEPIVKMKRILLRFLDFFSYWMSFFTHGKQGSIAIYLIICFSFAKAYVCLGLKLKDINKSPAWKYFIRKKITL